MKQEARYFEWCCEVVGENNPNPDVSRRCLLELMIRTPFEVVIEGDENRAGDVLELRWSYHQETGYAEPRFEISVLEVLMCLAAHVEFQTEDTPATKGIGGWFTELVDNMVGSGFRDSAWDDPQTQVDAEMALRLFNKRGYRRDGQGGPFWLRCPAGDQRERELWAQLGDYVMEATNLL